MGRRNGGSCRAPGRGVVSAPRRGRRKGSPLFTTVVRLRRAVFRPLLVLVSARSCVIVERRTVISQRRAVVGACVSVGSAYLVGCYSAKGGNGRARLP